MTETVLGLSLSRAGWKPDFIQVIARGFRQYSAGLPVAELIDEMPALGHLRPLEDGDL